MPRLRRQTYEQKKALARIRQQKVRAQEDNKIKEREKDKLRKRMNRQNPEYAEQCRMRSREYKRKCRAQEDYRIKEREQNNLYKRKCRRNPEFVEKYRERDKEYRRKIRAHDSYRKMERERDKFYMMAKQKLVKPLSKKLLTLCSTSIVNETRDVNEPKQSLSKNNQSILRAVRLKFKDTSKETTTKNKENLSHGLSVSSSIQDFENFAERNMVLIKQEIQEKYCQVECAND